MEEEACRAQEGPGSRVSHDHTCSGKISHPLCPSFRENRIGPKFTQEGICGVQDSRTVIKGLLLQAWESCTGSSCSVACEKRSHPSVTVKKSLYQGRQTSPLSSPQCHSPSTPEARGPSHVQGRVFRIFQEGQLSW